MVSTAIRLRFHAIQLPFDRATVIRLRFSSIRFLAAQTEMRG